MLARNRSSAGGAALEDALKTLAEIEGLSRDDLALARVLLDVKLADPTYVIEAARAVAGKPREAGGLRAILARLVEEGRLDARKARAVHDTYDVTVQPLRRR